MRKGEDDTTAAGMPPPTRGPADGRHTNDCAFGHKPRRPRASQPRPKGPPCTTRRRAVAQHTPTTHCRSDTPIGTTSTCPTRAADTRRMGAYLGSPWYGARTKAQQLPPTSPGRGPRFPSPATRLQQRKGRHHARTRPSTSPSSPTSRIHKKPGKGPGNTREAHGRADDHENVDEQSSRVLPSRASVQGYVHRGDRRASPPGELHAWDAGGVTAHITYANGTRDALPAES